MNLRAVVNFAIVGGCAIVFAGCASYYQVRDPASGMAYYTSDVDRPGESGAVSFKDDRTNRNVTLQNSEVREISRGEYERGLNTAPREPTTVIIR